MTIQTSAGLLERHMYQVRLRDSSAAATSKAVAGSSWETQVKPNETSNTEESAAPVLRRSARAKKPVQRYPP
ncbi:hypothetical protein HPB50_026062 [Hyalomma asiaticum]|uniref:Uncharacterized protein n=1 Tax=Hyalomma asiaticum TaxID=266040 RepID=A0ACB7T4E3_HYAAI|nr:hypothetical protein HPB50_026062 [Hyalomma asiaticum]